MDQQIEREYLEQYAGGQDWMEVSTGRKFFPARPRIEDISIFDIAHALARKCRFGGHIWAEHYSVAEHCCVMAMHAREIGLPARAQLDILLHDGGETYLPDIPRPIKHHFPEAIKMERAIHAMIRKWVGLDDQEMSPVIKELDSRIIRDERAQLMYQSRHFWQVDRLEPLGVKITGLNAIRAKMLFLGIYSMLTLEVFGKPYYLQYEKGEFDGTLAREAGVTVYNELAKPVPDIRAIDILGKLALIADNGRLLYVEGDYSLYNRIPLSALEASAAGD